MFGEIDKDYYCSADAFGGTEWCNLKNKLCIGVSQESYDPVYCSCYHRKFPTPAQFKEEYGFDYPDDWAVYYFEGRLEGLVWRVGILDQAKMYKVSHIVCACTPFGKPANDWKPE